jgi:Na+-driven multidrug efflux pump
MGVVGAALATTLSTCAAALIFLARLHWHDRSQFEPLPSSEESVKRAKGFMRDALLPWR